VDSGVPFEAAPTANTERSTVSDNVSGEIDTANVSRNLMNDNGNIGTLILPSFVFQTESTTSDYLVNVEFKETETGDSVFIDTFFNQEDLVELRFENPPGLGISPIIRSSSRTKTTHTGTYRSPIKTVTR